MAPHCPSILQSIGSVLHRFPASRPISYKSCGAFEQDSPSKVFEETLAARLRSLCSTKDSQVLSLEWLNKAIQVLIATIVDAHALIPEIQLSFPESYEQWMTHYLEDSLSVLHACNIIRENIAGLDSILLIVKLTVHLFDLQAHSDTNALGRVKNALSECVVSLQNWGKNLQGRVKVNMKAGHPVIQNMPKVLLSAKSEYHVRKNPVTMISYAAKLTTVVICSIMVTALTGQGGFLAELSVPECFAWSIPIQVLNSTFREVTFKKIKEGLNFDILELCNVEVSLTNLKELLDGHEDNNNKEVIGKTDALVINLKFQTEVLENSLKSLQGEVDKLFYLTIGNRKALLDKLRDHGPQHILM